MPSSKRRFLIEKKQLGIPARLEDGSTSAFELELAGEPSGSCEDRTI
jgi:hypothetical protein